MARLIQKVDATSNNLILAVHHAHATVGRPGGASCQGLTQGGYGRRTAAWARREGWHAPSALPAGTPVPVRGPGGSSSSRGAGSAASEAPNRLLGLPQGGMGVSPCAERPSRARQALEGRARARAVKGGHVGARAQRRDVLDRTPSRVGLGESGSTGARGETLACCGAGRGMRAARTLSAGQLAERIEMRSTTWLQLPCCTPARTKWAAL